MASVRLHHGSWQVRYRDVDGAMRSQSFRLKSEARRFANNVETDLDRGDWQDPALVRVPFGTFAARWLDESTHLKPATRSGYTGLLHGRLLPTFGDTPLGRISPTAVRAWAAGLDESGMSASRQRQAIQLLGQIMRAAAASGHVRRSPVVGVKVRPTPKREVRVLEPEEVDTLAAAIAEPYGVLVYVLAYGGLRFGEAVALRRSDVDPLRSRLRVERARSEVGGRIREGATKTYAARHARLPRFVSEMLAEHLVRRVGPEPDALLFSSPSGDALRHGNFMRSTWTPAVAEAKIPGARPHDLRHTCASFLIRQGASVRAVAEQLGHSSPVVTLNVYSHLYAGDLDRLYDGLDAERASEGCGPGMDQGPYQGRGRRSAHHLIWPLTCGNTRWALQDSNL